MCNHEYTASYAHRPRGMGSRCPYPDLYDKLQSKGAGASGKAADLTLPLDDGGACIFHSRSVEWKRENGFGRRFAQLLQLLDADEDRSWYDFAEFLFIGDESESEADPGSPVFRIHGRPFQKGVYFTGASFLDPVELADVDFLDTVSFGEATFDRGLRIENTKFRVLDFAGAYVKQPAIFSGVEFRGSAVFHASRFSGQTEGRAVGFERSRFHRMAIFSNVEFEHLGEGGVGFAKVQFEDFLDFTGALFHCHAAFHEVSFAAAAEFIDTSFGTVRSAARYRGAGVEFTDIDLREGAVLTFQSSDPRKKMFNHDIEMRFRGEPAGIIQFENVNFSKFTPGSRKRLLLLEKSGRVEIGPGCIKYRHQTDVRSIAVSHGNASLVLELCQTFANYFTASNGINLGFEIVERTKEHISFFYFTDEDIAEEAFLERLRQTEAGLWNLLTIRSTGQLMALAGSAGTTAPAPNESGVINAIDGISALIGTFFRVGARIALGDWREADTKALLGAVRFNEEGADERARNLHGVIVEKYTGRALFGINTRQNKGLPLLIAGDQESPPTEKVRILFLGANSSTSRMELGQEIKKIKTNLKLAKERDSLELRQEFAVTADTFMQAMIEEKPTIVHFSGHGEESGILLQDENGILKLVDAEALSRLFKLFKQWVQCVVLNSCYSIHQAEAIRLHIPYVIGMSAAVPDDASIAFSTGFYKAIGAGEEIPFAFELGKVAIRMEGISAENVPVLL